MKKVGILGAGPAGCACAYFLKDSCSVTLIDFASPLRTILPTGGGRCNLAHAEYDFRELVKYYPRGNKFLFSVFSRFATSDTVEFFENLGVTTYVQEDYRIFPDTDSASDVRDALLRNLDGVVIKKEKGLRLKSGDRLKLVTDMNSYEFDAVVIATGGHGGYDIIKRLGVNIIPPVPALVGLTSGDGYKSVAGVTVPECRCEGVTDSMLFTHKGVSGPLIYKISSIKARDKFPYTLSIDLCPAGFDLQELMNLNPHKHIDNLLSEILPKRLAGYILKRCSIDSSLKCHRINGQMRDKILDCIHSFKVNAGGTCKDGEVVTAGGVDLAEVNPKTLESKKIKGLYFIGEVLDIDGFCGGFNLQNCWSTAYVAADAISS